MPYSERVSEADRKMLRRVSSARWRCENPNCRDYPRYGGRGLTFELGSNREAVAYILEAIGPLPAGMELDRIDNERGYVRGNLRWATKREQALNRRSTVRLSDGRPAWPEAAKRMSRWNFLHRLRRGWSVDRAALEPVRRSSRREDDNGEA